MTMGQRLTTMADRMIERMAESSKSSSRISAFFDVLDEAEADPSALARRRLLDFMEILDRALTIRPCDVDFMEADAVEDKFEDGCSFGAGCDYHDGFDACRFVIPRVIDALIRYESEVLAGFLGRGQRPEVQAELVASAKVDSTITTPSTSSFEGLWPAHHIRSDTDVPIAAWIGSVG